MNFCFCSGEAGLKKTDKCTNKCGLKEPGEGINRYVIIGCEDKQCKSKRVKKVFYVKGETCTVDDYYTSIKSCKANEKQEL